MNKKEKDLELYNKLISKHEYSSGQRLEILKGIKKDLDVSWYSNPAFNAYQMREIRKGLENKLNVEIYAKSEFNEDQMMVIRWGLQN